MSVSGYRAGRPQKEKVFPGQLKYALWLSTLLTTLLACSNGTSSTKATPSENHPHPSGPLAQAPNSPSSEKSNSNTFAAGELSGLNTTQKSVFAQIVNDEICPCDCPKTFGQCLAANSRCEPAILLGQWVADHLVEGLPAEVLIEALARELGHGFTSSVKPLTLKGYQQKGATKPKWEIVEFADFECLHCKMAADVMRDLVNKYPKTVRHTFKHYPLKFHALARDAAIAVEAAGRQGKFWPMHDAVFNTQMMLDEPLLVGHAKALGLDLETFEKDRKDPAVIALVDLSRQEGERHGVDSTPFFFINGRPYHLMRSIEGFELRFKMEEVRATSSCQ